MKLTTIKDLHSFVFDLMYRFAEIPTNVSVRVDLSQTEYLKLLAEIDKGNCLLPKGFTSSDIGGWFTYQYMNVKFYIHIDKTITE